MSDVDIDPILQDGAAGSSDPPVDDTQAATPEETLDKPKKVRGIIPGSSADYRRREANRLAAVRSRSRAHEKKQGLDVASKELGEENTRLKAEIARMEGVDVSEIRGDTDAAEAARLLQASETGAVDAGEDAASGDAQESNSRTILAALMSSAVDGSFDAGAEEEGQGSWMKGVEDMLEDADSNGRLGELAAVAAGRDDKGTGDTLNGERGSKGKQADNKAGDDSAEDAKPLEYDPSAADAATASAMAIAINVEMERVLRDDLVAIKLAMAKVEKQLARLQAGDEKLEDEDGDDTDTYFPGVIRSQDLMEMSEYSTGQGEKAEAIENEMPKLRQSVMDMKVSKMGDEKRLADLIVELQAVGTDNTNPDRPSVGNLLKAVTGYIGTLLGHDSTVLSSTTASPYSSPAIALRARGRPPKTHTGLPTPSRLAAGVNGKSGSPNMLGEVGGTSGTPLLPRTTKRKSRLSKQVVPEPEEVNDQAEETQDSTLNEADANETERMILSHLENSSSFDFLPTQVDLDPNLDPALGENPTQEATEVENEGVDDPMAVSAVSRIKKGPPGSCDICGRTETSVWRKLSLGGNDMKVCNACGLYHVKFGIIRPPALWGDGKSLKKRRVTPRNSNANAEDGEGPGPRKKARKSDGNHVEDEVDEVNKGDVVSAVEALQGVQDVETLGAMDEDQSMASLLQA